MRPSILREKKPKASPMGKIIVMIIVETRVLPITLNHDMSKSDSIPPVRPKERGYSLRSALTRSKRKAVLKNCTKKVTLVVSKSCIVSVG